MPSPASSKAKAWSEDRISALSRLWAEGLTAAQIAQRLGGVSRNAVIGKVHRLGLGVRGPTAGPRAVAVNPTPRPRPRRLPAPRPGAAIGPKVRSPDVRPEPEAPGLVDDLADLGRHACRWPIGDPKAAGFSFCGRPSDGRYCAAHQARAFRPDAARRVDDDPVVKRALAGLA